MTSIFSEESLKRIAADVATVRMRDTIDPFLSPEPAAGA